MFGKLIGAGVGGYVFESTKNEGRCFKLVALPDKPLKFYGLKSDVGRVYGINENQADLFSMLSEATNPSSALPKVYKYYEGEVNKKLLEATRQENFYLPLPIGQEIAVWEMEKIPCVESNNFCGVSHPYLPPLENRQYQSLLSYLLKNEWVVRDIAADDNYGYRRNGEQVWFDPVVAPWPKTGITVSMKDSTNPVIKNQYQAFVTAYGVNQIAPVRKALQNKRYFGYYHQGGVLQAEEETFESKLQPLNPKTFWNEWAKLLMMDKEYRFMNVLNFKSSSPAYRRLAEKNATLFWQYYYEMVAENIWELMSYLEDSDTNHLAVEVYAALTPNDWVRGKNNAIWDNATQPAQLSQWTGGKKKELPPLWDDDYQDGLLGVQSSMFDYLLTQNIGKPTALPSYEDFINIQEIQFIKALFELKNQMLNFIICDECNGSGTITHYGPQDQEHESPCDNCGRHGTFDLEVIDNDWAREHTKIVKGERSFVRQFKGWKK